MSLIRRYIRAGQHRPSQGMLSAGEIRTRIDSVVITQHTCPLDGLVRCAHGAYAGVAARRL